MKCLNAFKILIGEEIHIYELRIDNGMRREKICVPYLLFFWWEHRGRGNGGRNLFFLSLGMPLASTRRTLALFLWFRHLKFQLVQVKENEKRWCLDFVVSDLDKKWVSMVEARIGNEGSRENEKLQISDFKFWIYRARDVL